jgi:hypothetical protein
VRRPDGNGFPFYGRGVELRDSLLYTDRMLPRDKEPDLPPDPVIEAYKKDIDRTLLKETLKQTPAQRFANLQKFMRSVAGLRGAARRRA